jgi:hypothetical protein
MKKILLSTLVVASLFSIPANFVQASDYAAEQQRHALAECYDECDGAQSACTDQCSQERYGSLPPPITDRTSAILGGALSALKDVSLKMCENQCGSSEDQCRQNCNTQILPQP